MRTQPRHVARPSGAHRRRLRRPVAASTAGWLALVAIFAVGASPARATVPTANDDAATTVASTAAYISVLDNDSDPDFEPLQVTGATQPDHGTVTCTPGGICVYLPDAGFTGSDVFGYDVTDGTDTASADVSVTVTPAIPGNQPPIAGDDEFTAGSGAWAFLLVLDNDTDPDSDTLQVNSATEPAHGTLDCSSSVYCVYESDLGYSGPDAFTYAVADKRGGTDTGDVAVTVEPNHAPTATDDSLVTRANAGSRSVNVIANDSDADGDSLTAKLLAAPQHGTASCSDKVCQYAPATNYVGPDTFTYTADDDRGGTDAATVSVDVTVNHPPAVVDEQEAAVQGVTLALSLLDNDSDLDGDRLHVVDNSSPDHGDLTCDDNGFCDYTADDGFVGTDEFTYVVSDGSDTTTGHVQISVTEPCPPARCIDNGTIALAVHPEGHLNVPDGAGSVAGAGPVGLTFLPTGNEATAPGCLCEGWGAADAASGVTGYVSGETDAGANNMTVDSFDATATTAQSVVTIDGTMRVTHDFHPSALTPNLYEIDVTIENLTDEQLDDIRYRRVTDWDVEPTAFSEYVTIHGGGASNLLFDSDHGFATANPLGERPSILATGDFVDSGPVDHGALFDFGFGALGAGSQRSFTIYYGAAATELAAQSALDAVGAEVYSLAQPDTEDGATLGTPNTFMVAFSGVDDDGSEPPVAVDDELTTDQDAAASVDVLANDTDPDGDTLVVTTPAPAAEHGDISCTDAGLCTYTPDAGFSGSDTFDYAISDGNGGSDSATVDVGVVPVEPGNVDPVAVDDVLSVDAGASGSVDVLANDSDPDGDTLSVTTSAPLAEHGDVLCSEAGDCVYTPDDGYSGADAFDYSISDGNGGSAAATVLVEVAPVSGQLALILEQDQVEAEYSDPVGPIAVTTTGGGPAADTELSASGLPAAVALSDTGDGTGSIGGTLTVGRGGYDGVVTATNGDESANQTLGISVLPESATVEYAGDLDVALADREEAAEATLSAQLRQEADGSSGDLTKARVYFDLYDEENTAMAVPDLTVGPVAPGDDGAATTLAELGAGVWTVVVRFDQSNDYFTGSAAEASTIDVGAKHEAHKAFGAGWVADAQSRGRSWSHGQGPHHPAKSTSGLGRFCFAYGDRAEGGVWGSASYSWRDSDGRRYFFRSGNLNRTSFAVGQEGAGSTAKGMGEIWMREAPGRHQRSHKHGESVGRVWFRMDVVDGTSHSGDRFALSLWKDGQRWHRVSLRVVSHGYVTVV